MQIHKIDNQSFQGINSAKATQKILYRVGSSDRYLEFMELCKKQNANPIEIQLDIGRHKNIIGTITDSDGNVLYTKKECVVCGLLNLSPIRFISKLCKKANKFNTGK